jgi:hypothetical protein
MIKKIHLNDEVENPLVIYTTTRMESISSVVSTKEVDYLDEDKAIRGQNYVCLSFISPEDVLANKEVFMFNKFMASVQKDMSTIIDMLKIRYPDDVDLLENIKATQSHFFSNKDVDLQEQYRFFKQSNEGECDREFLEQNDFKTCVRGIKVRGVFETIKEAQVRAEVLKRMGDKFDIFIGQVGCWCPWSPNPNDMPDQEYGETQLNTLMKNYKQNMQLKDEFFEIRKQEKVTDALTAKDAWTKRMEEEAKASKASIIEDTAAAATADSPAEVEAEGAPVDPMITQDEA